METNTLLYPQAKMIAEELVEELKLHCTRIAIAGSVRRQKATVGDIELVCIPRREPEMGLFGPVGMRRRPEFAETVRKLGKVVKGDPEAGKYIQLVTAQGVQIDLFTAQEDNWGLIFAIRTGSAEYSKWLATSWCAHGFHSVDGHLQRGGHMVPVSEEPDLFRMLGIPYAHPTKRNL